MTHNNPLFSDLKTKYATATEKRQSAKDKMESAEKEISQAESEMRKFKDAWIALKVVYPDMPELDNRPNGTFADGNDQEDLKTASIKTMIIKTVTAIGHFTNKSEIEDRMLSDFAMVGLKSEHLTRMSQYLKHLKESAQLVRAKGDNSNRLTYWGLPEFTQDIWGGKKVFLSGKEPLTTNDIKSWDFQTGKGSDDELFDPEKE